MSLLSEYAIIKMCVEKPQKIDNNLSQLNLKFIRDPADRSDEDFTQCV